jgi:ADP-heptose:LPS heptosyltransferase
MPTPNIAVMKFSALGDIAAILPFLRQMSPPPCIVTSPLGKAFLEDEFTSFIVMPDKTVKSHLRLIRDVRSRGFQDIIDLQGNDRSRFLSKAFVLANKAQSHNGFNKNYKYQPFSPMAQKISQDAQAAQVFQPKPRDYIVLNAGSSAKWSAKRPPPWKWQEFATILDKRFNLPFKLTGSEEEIEYISNIAEQLSFDAEIVAGKTTLSELKSLLRNAFLTVSTDSAAMHISAVEGTPTIGIYGSTTQKSIPNVPWAAALWDHKYYPDGKLPKCTAEHSNYYDNIKIEQGLEELEIFLKA